MKSGRTAMLTALQGLQYRLTRRAGFQSESIQLKAQCKAQCYFFLTGKKREAILFLLMNFKKKTHYKKWTQKIYKKKL